MCYLRIFSLGERRAATEFRLWSLGTEGQLQSSGSRLVVQEAWLAMPWLPGPSFAGKFPGPVDLKTEFLPREVSCT